MIAVLLNVGGGVRLIKPAKLCMCTQNTTNTTRTDARCRMCAAVVPYRWATRGTSLRELEHTHIARLWIDKLLYVPLPDKGRQHRSWGQIREKVQVVVNMLPVLEMYVCKDM